MKFLLKIAGYTLLAYIIWMVLAIILYMILPEALRESKLYVSITSGLSAALVVLFSIFYLRKIKTSSWKEGLRIGLLATLVVILLDIAHNLMMGADMGMYFSQTLPAYFFIPLLTTLIMGCLEKRRSIDIG
jgi:branched-subunit amino acid transport protein AzlD